MSQPQRRVLIIDDDQWFAEVQINAFRRAGFVPAYAADALAGMRQIDVMVPDLIILDLFMPGANGLVLLHELQSYSDLGRIPIILCTNNADTLVGQSLLPYGVVAILDKTSMHPNDIITAARRVMSA